jgi:2,5-diamino-6-(ribosylamino)-4(3H)-pyrimidinone 5'-phosphate reductase
METAVQRPFVYVNMAMTADGKITSASREYPTFTSPRDKRTMDRLRAEADAVLIGAGTLRADDPPLGVRDAGMREYRRSLGKPDGLYHVVVSTSLDLDPSCRFFREEPVAGRIVATVEEAPEESAGRLAGLAEVWRVGRREVDLPELFRRLREAGVERLLVEGGGELNWAVAREGLLDELYVTVAPSLLGGAGAPTLLEGTGFPMEDRIRLRLLGVNRQEDEVFFRYAVVR